MKNSKPKIYILESPSHEDFFKNKCEGIALSEILKLSDIENIHFMTTNRKSFIRAIEEIRNDCRIRKNNNLNSIPYLHISSHGNKDGVGFTSGELLKWQELAQILDIINQDDHIGYMSTSYSSQTMSPIVLSLSSCFGLEGIQMTYNYPQKSPYSILIAPTKEIDWPAAAIAFASFYYNSISVENGFQAPECVQIMNWAIGEKEIFDFAFGKEMEEAVKNREKINFSDSHLLANEEDETDQTPSNELELEKNKNYKVILGGSDRKSSFNKFADLVSKVKSNLKHPVKEIIITDPYIIADVSEQGTAGGFENYKKILMLITNNDTNHKFTIKITGSPKIGDTSNKFNLFETYLKKIFKNVSIKRYSSRLNFHDRIYIFIDEKNHSKGIFGPSLNGLNDNDIFICGEINEVDMKELKKLFN